MIRFHLRTTLLATVALLTLPIAIRAQDHVGGIDVIVRDDARGAPLSGVALEARGSQTATTATDARGRAHFVGLAPGVYVVIGKLRGFNEYHSVNVNVSAGVSIPLEMWMSVEGAARQVDARIDAPRVDPRAMTVSTIVGRDELQRVPWQGDPWTVLQTIPSVFVDRVNVAGEYSGQQSLVLSKGVTKTDHVWTLDGIPVTDMSAPGSSAVYFDMSAIEEMRVTTGGGSPGVETPGVQIDIVLPSGGDRWHGSGRAYYGNHAWQSDNMTSAVHDQLSSYGRAGDYADAGVEGGGPAIAQRLFVWGSAGRTRPERRIFATGSADDADTEIARDTTTLTTYAAKATAEIDGRTRARFTFFRNRKTETGRGASALDRYGPTLDQDGPAAMYAVGIQRRLRGDVFVDARLAHLTNEFTITHTTTRFTFEEDRPQTSALVDGHWFSGLHQLAFGFSWRDAKDRLMGASLAEGAYLSGYGADTIVTGPLTLGVAARWDRSRSSSSGQNIVWNSLTPRVAATYVLGEERTTVLRGSYAILPSQLAATVVDSVLSEPAFDLTRSFHRLAASGVIGDYRTPLTHEAVFGAEHALSTGLSLTGLLTWRRTTNANWVHYRGVTGSDYVLETTLTGDEGPIRGVDVPVYVIPDDAVPADLAAIYEARPGYHQRYWGFEAAGIRRFSDRLMGRLGFSTNDQREYFANLDAMADPTPTVESPNRNGGTVLRHSNVSGTGDVYMLLPRYQFAGTIFYQAPLVDLAANYTFRQGFAAPYFRSGLAPDALAPEGKNVLLVPEAGFIRLSPAHTLAARVSKSFTTRWPHAIETHVDLDVFNVFNRGIVLTQRYDVARPDFGNPLEIMNPRVMRLGVRVAF